MTKTAPPSNRSEQDARAEDNSGKAATTPSRKPGSGQHAANHVKAGKTHGAGGGAKQRHGPR
ncbi:MULTISPECIES: hypothetical protein [unclassified Cupriavidus]|uniref:hypothetical protein n=1 Tax=unclassified Cupriavidus TaxID=2640874 RepID=UPI001BFFE989|nr:MULTISPECIES: hypothetical protein [unclassified Cupriavidus]MCA3182858.1 hypothetical protein [Cupriavidus sp.]MCA3191821.1 hypothetical protein [Cupriavidus sp.]MCA3198052.1 hypothetical protein [Cupriavidus sp.]QWE96297.1 hypothetical protein KLP38_24115 [Cupriavidus sp. EM10]